MSMMLIIITDFLCIMMMTMPETRSSCLFATMTHYIFLPSTITSQHLVDLIRLRVLVVSPDAAYTN